MPRTSDPSYLQPLHQFRPTKPSHGFTRIGLGRFRHKPKTPGRFQTYLLFTMYSEQASSLAEDANFYFFKRIFNLPINPPTQADRPSRLVARAVRSEAIEDRDSVRTDPCLLKKNVCTVPCGLCLFLKIVKRRHVWRLPGVVGLFLAKGADRGVRALS